jgi:hypothetical protein
MQSTVENPERLALVLVTRDETKIWRHGIGPRDLPESVMPPVEVDHRHVRTGQYRRGHDTVHYFPEYFEAIATLLRGSDVILLCGHGSGKASSAEQFLDYLQRKHPEIASRIVDQLELNLNALSDGQITMNARQWFEKNYRKLATWHDRQPKRWFTS